MLELKNIVKDYVSGDTSVRALKGISLAFRKSEFVSILGPSGCGKTTMLNILGGLDRYTEGDLLINGRSTKDFAPSDWDAYRNGCVGFVFQNYNLIPHQSVLSNVELALTLSGINRTERIKRATEALQLVGLGEQLNKKPNQLSGGQMQRVAIARAIVNDPEIILADEPTGALDSKTSVQIIELLKEISADRLVVMVTHNDVIANDFSTRIIRMQDGEILGDTMPYEAPPYELNEEELRIEAMVESVPKPDIDMFTTEAEKANAIAKYDKQCAKVKKKQAKIAAKARKAKLEKTSMSFFTAFKLSLKNLFTKKWRTIMVSVAGSIGIIGIALVLAVSNGFTGYVNKLQSDTLSGMPITISQYTTDMDKLMTMPSNNSKPQNTKFPTDGSLNIYEEQKAMLHYNKITKDYLNYLEKMDQSLRNDISYSYGMNMNVLGKKVSGTNVSYVATNTMPSDMLSGMMGGSGGYWQELLDTSFINTQYDVIEGTMPINSRNADGSFDIALVVDSYNRISAKTLGQLGIQYDKQTDVKLDDMLGRELRLILNDDWFKMKSSSNYFDVIQDADYPAAYANGVSLRISGVIRIKESSAMSLYSNGVVYPSAVTKFLIEDSKNSEIGKKQAVGDKIWLPKETIGETLGMFLKPGGDIKTLDFSIIGVDVKFTKEEVAEMLKQLVGVSDIPTAINIYPSSFETKNTITAYLDAYNTKNNLTGNSRILYLDASAVAANIVEQLINTISIVLVAFAAISLVVSSIMIGIITYISVIERTKEIGVLRSIGARKKDISRVFNAETIMIGLVAGVIGVLVALILTVPLNAILVSLAGGMVVGSLVVMNPVAAIVLIVVSVGLTFLSGLVPSRIASKRDPVKALRSE